MAGSKQDWKGFRRPMQRSMQLAQPAPDPNQEPQNQVPCIHCGCGSFTKGFEVYRSRNPLAITQVVLTVVEKYICMNCKESTDVKVSPTIGEMEGVVKERELAQPIVGPSGEPIHERSE